MLNCRVRTLFFFFERGFSGGYLQYNRFLWVFGGFQWWLLYMIQKVCAAGGMGRRQ